MEEYLDSKFGKNLMEITSIQELLSSYLVAQAVREIRKKRQAELKNKLAPLAVRDLFEDPRLSDIFLQFIELANYKKFYMEIMKTILLEMERSDFKDDPSVVLSATKDTAHLREAYGANDFAMFANISLYDHTIHVIEQAMQMVRKKGRATQYLLPIIGSALHDFGKSTKIRQRLLSEERGQYKAHAAVSKMYVEEVLRPLFPRHEEAINALEFMVENHHTMTQRIKKDSSVAFIMEADKKARAMERRELKEQMNAA